MISAAASNNRASRFLNNIFHRSSKWSEKKRPVCDCGSGARITRCLSKQCSETATDVCHSKNHKRPLMKTRCKCKATSPPPSFAGEAPLVLKTTGCRCLEDGIICEGMCWLNFSNTDHRNISGLLLGIKSWARKSARPKLSRQRRALGSPPIRL